LRARRGGSFGRFRPRHPEFDPAAANRAAPNRNPSVPGASNVAYTGNVMPRVKVTIIFESGARIGPGKVLLLKSIRDTGSISAAAREMRMSYKRAWVLLDSMNQAFTEPLVTAAPGGTGGGGAALTAFGAEVLERYRRILGFADAQAAADLAALGRRARAEPVAKV
jgi:molybdate transport system regulatory protein